MWTRKASFTFTGGIALILIGMMIANLQMMILGLTFIAFIVVNSWISGHGDVEVQRTLSADNLYKGDDLYVELLVTNRSNRNTQLLEVYDNIPHEMKLRSGLNQMRLNLKPGESARIRYVLRCPLQVISRLDRSHCVHATPSTWVWMKCMSTTTATLSSSHKSKKLRKHSSVHALQRCTLEPQHCEHLDRVQSSTHCENTSPATRSRTSIGRPSPEPAI